MSGGREKTGPVRVGNPDQPKGPDVLSPGVPVDSRSKNSSTSNRPPPSTLAVHGTTAIVRTVRASTAQEEVAPPIQDEQVLLRGHLAAAAPVMLRIASSTAFADGLAPWTIVERRSVERLHIAVDRRGPVRARREDIGRPGPQPKANLGLVRTRERRPPKPMARCTA